MRQWLLAVVTMGLTACSGSIESPDAFRLLVKVDSDFTVQQRDMIHLGADFWRSQLNVAIDEQVVDCQINEVSCLTSVPADHRALLVKGELMTATELNGRIHIREDLEGEGLALATAHEIGHRLGLSHGSGVMAENLGDCTWDSLTEEQFDRLPEEML